MVPGIWFTPVFPFDLDGDGADEIWFVNNIDPDHPLTIRGQRLERLDARTGKSTGRFRWPQTPAWEREIPAGPGPRGSHGCAVADLDGDGVEEVLWGACGDCETCHGHSDVVEPFIDWKTGRWHFFTCRENGPKTKPRVAAFDAAGKRTSRAWRSFFTTR